MLNLMKDLMNSSLSKEEVVRKAWDVRDSAVKRKNSAEIELAKERIAGMQINSQLLEAIQQKVELSQQLEQWQVYRKIKQAKRTVVKVELLNFRLTWSRS
jgi:coiled-coil domain-containing protein 64